MNVIYNTFKHHSLNQAKPINNMSNNSLTFQIPKRRKIVKDEPISEIDYKEILDTFDESDLQMVATTPEHLQSRLVMTISQNNQECESKIASLKESNRNQKEDYQRRYIESYNDLKVKLKQTFDEDKKQFNATILGNTRNNILRNSDPTLYELRHNEKKWIEDNKGEYDAIKQIAQELNEQNYNPIYYFGNLPGHLVNPDGWTWKYELAMCFECKLE